MQHRRRSLEALILVKEALKMLQGRSRHSCRVLANSPYQSKRFHAWDLRLLKHHVCTGTPGFLVAFHTTRISDAAGKLSRREYLFWIQAEYPREVFSGTQFRRLRPLVPDASMSSQDADLQMLEELIVRYSPSTMLELNSDTLKVVKGILNSLRRLQTDIYIPEIRNTLRTYSLRTSIKWLYASLYRYRGWGHYSYPRPLELTVGDRYALMEAIRYYNPEKFGSYNKGAVPIVSIIRAYLRWYLWKLQIRFRRGPKPFVVVRHRRRYTWKPHLPVIRE